MPVLVALADESVLKTIRERCEKILVSFRAEEIVPSTTVDLEQSIIKFGTDEPMINIEFLMSFFESKELSIQGGKNDRVCLYIWYRFDEDFVAKSETDLRRREGTKDHKEYKKNHESVLLWYRIKLPLFPFLDWCAKELPSLLETLDTIMVPRENKQRMDQRSRGKFVEQHVESSDDSDDDQHYPSPASPPAQQSPEPPVATSTLKKKKTTGSTYSVASNKKMKSML